MANETAVQTSCIQENHEDDECLENIPPGVTSAAGTSKLKVQVGDVAGCSSTQPGGENEPLSDSCSFSTPAPTSGNGRVKSRLSGLQSALTPILKYLNIGNKCPSPEPLNHENSLHVAVPSFSFGNTTANCQKSAGGFFQHPNSGTTAPVCMLDDEYLPEITLLDATCDSTVQLTKNDSVLPDSVPATPVKAGSVCSTFATMQHPRFSSSVSKKTSKTSLGSCDVQDITFDKHSLQKSSGNTILGEAEAATFCHQNNAFDTKPPPKQKGTITISSHPKQDKSSAPKESNSQVRPLELSKHNETTDCGDPDADMLDIPEGIDAPMRWLDDRLFPEITLLDVTRDSESSPRGEMSRMELTQDIFLVDSLQKNVPQLQGQIASEPGTSDINQSEELSRTLEGNVTQTIGSFCEQSDKCAGETKASLEVTRDISMGSVLEDSGPSLDPSEQNMGKIQTSAEDTGTLSTHPANVTHDISSSSSDMSVQCAASQISTSDVQCDTSSKTVTSELHGEPVVTSDAVEANKEELLTGRDAELTSKVPQASPKTAGSVNSTFTVNEHSRLSAANSLNMGAQTPCPQNKTLDLPSSNVNGPKVESEAKDQASSVSKNATPSSGGKESSSCDVRNATFDRHSLHRSSGNTILGEAGAATFSLQNNTFDTNSPFKQNGTITLSKTSSTDQNNTFDAKSPSKQNGTITLSETSSTDQNTSDKPSDPVVFNATSSPKPNDPEVHPPELSETTDSKIPDAKMVDTPESTFEANPAVEVVSGAAAFCLQNNTFDAKSPSKQNGTITLSETSSTDQNTLDKLSAPVVFNATSSPKPGDSDVNHPELSKQNGTTDSKESEANMADTPESTFEANPAVEVVSGAGAAAVRLQNNTFDTKSPSKQNGKITLSETSSTDSHQITMHKPSAPMDCNATSSPKDKDSEIHIPELSKQTRTTDGKDPDAKMFDPPQSTFGANPAVEVASGGGRRETKDYSRSSLPSDGLSDTLNNQSVDTEMNKANTLNLDDTLDLRADSLITSTPMTNCKFTFQADREASKILAAQKKLYGDCPGKPDGQAPSEVPSNIICDRKTFLTQPAVKSLLPPSKAASQLLKYKPASALPGPMTTGLLMTRQRTKEEALRNAAASDAPQVATGISSCYNLRTTGIGSKQPISGLRKPHPSGIPSGIQRAATGLRPPTARSNLPAPSTADQVHGPTGTATNPATKILQAKKHPLSRGETLPITKKKKMDAPLPSGSAESSTSTCDANKAKGLKRPAATQRTLPTKIQRADTTVPTSAPGASASCDAVSRTRALKCPAASHRALLAKPQSQAGCAKCVTLEQQLELKSEEIRRLKEELLKYSKPEEEC